MQRSGLEWFYRLLSEPRRLYRRYLVNIPLFGWYLLRDALGVRPVGSRPASDGSSPP
jgi:N-acetylglucosaminyldiphosphoundecaprenol N-acetyl-beta-D-mannosaminyltransferase